MSFFAEFSACLQIFCRIFELKLSISFELILAIISYLHWIEINDNDDTKGEGQCVWWYAESKSHQLPFSNNFDRNMKEIFIPNPA